MIKLKKILFVLLVASCMPYPINCMNNTQEKKEIIVDPIFFIEPDMIAGIQSLGAFNLASQWLGSWFGGPDPEKLLPEFFKEMKALDGTTPPAQIFYQEFEAPNLLYTFLIGEKMPQETLEIFENYIKEHHDNHHFDPTLMKLCAEMTFDPEKNANVMKPIPAAVNLIALLGKQGNTVHVLGNWNNTLFERLKEKMSSIFSTIKGEKIVSGDLKMAKGSAMYAKLFEKCAMDLDTVIVIEPYPTVAAELQKTYPELTIIISKNSSMRDIQKELKNHGALS